MLVKSMRTISFLPLKAILATASVLCPLAAQPRVALRGSVSPLARTSSDTGLAAPQLTIPRVTLRFALTPAQNAALDRLLADQQNPSSPRYRQWLTPEQFARSFGLDPATLASVTAWLQAQGLAVTEVARSRTFVAVSGSAAQVQAAFGTPLHTVSRNGEPHIAALADPTLPAPIAAVVAGITGLDDFRLTPAARVRPAYTSSTTGNHYLAPGDFYTLYDINPLLNSSINGAGVGIAVLGQTDISLNDAASFRTAAGLTANLPIPVLYGADPGVSAADIDEAQLDVEWAGAVAPLANILYVNSTNVLEGSLTAAVDNKLAPIVSLSYSSCESGLGTSAIALYTQLLRQANAQGQTVVSPAGDSGATACDTQTASATQGAAVNFPASSPYVTGVGGTMFTENGGSYWSPANGGNAGSALSYIPEAVWNETAAFGTLAASGGGASAYFTKPAFQTGNGVPSDYSRDVPDVALAAGSNHDGYLFCSQGFCTNGFRNAAGNLDVSGGTSVATPAFAGILALLEQKIGSSLGNANPVIYGLANSSYAGSVFHDITSGNDNSPCSAGSTGCPASGAIGYSAAAGYDLASGWGSVDAFHLVSDWLLVTPSGAGSTIGQTASTTLLTTSSTSVTAGTTVSLTVSVASQVAGGATPTGTVQILLDGSPVGAAIAIANGSGSVTLSTSGIGAGLHLLGAIYSGDSTYAGSKAVLNLTVTTASAPDFTLTPSTVSVAVASGGTASGIAFIVAPLNGFTGSVNLSASATLSSLKATYSFNVDPVVLTSTASGSSVLTMLAFVANDRGGHGLAENRRQLAGTGVAFAGLLLLCVPRRRRRWTPLCLAVLALALLPFSGCTNASSGASTSNQTNTPPGAYTIVVTATGTSGSGTVVTHNAQVSFTVN
jgi:subtilase family serine protease